jgi:hypothetical protein
MKLGLTSCGSHGDWPQSGRTSAGKVNGFLATNVALKDRALVGAEEATDGVVAVLVVLAVVGELTTLVDV